MKHKFTAEYTLYGHKQTAVMEYDDKEIQATLTRRIKTAFPAATDITITEVPDPQLPLTATTKK